MTFQPENLMSGNNNTLYSPFHNYACFFTRAVDPWRWRNQISLRTGDLIILWCREERDPKKLVNTSHFYSEVTSEPIMAQNVPVVSEFVITVRNVSLFSKPLNLWLMEVLRNVKWRGYRPIFVIIIIFTTITFGVVLYCPLVAYMKC
jgi:hypothetical protein